MIEIKKHDESGCHKMAFFFLFGNCLNFGVNSLNLMIQARKPGRPREWVLNEEIIEIHRLATELKTRNPQIHWSKIGGMLKKQLEQNERKDLLSKIDKIIGLMKQVIPMPPRCICGHRVYSYTYKKVENEREHYWEVFARCVNPDCRYMRRYLPDTTYKWSRPKSFIKELAKTPTFYEMDRQLVEEPRR